MKELLEVECALAQSEVATEVAYIANRGSWFWIEILGTGSAQANQVYPPLGSVTWYRT